jgi:hypothetical protein
MCIERSRTRALEKTEWVSVVRVAKGRYKGAAVLKKQNSFSTITGFKY